MHHTLGNGQCPFCFPDIGELIGNIFAIFPDHYGCDYVISRSSRCDTAAYHDSRSEPCWQPINGVSTLCQYFAIISLAVAACCYCDFRSISCNRQRSLSLPDFIVSSFEASSFSIGNRVCSASCFRDRAGCLDVRSFAIHESIAAYCNIRSGQRCAIVFSGLAFRSQRYIPFRNGQCAVILRNCLELIRNIFVSLLDDYRCYFVFSSSDISDAASYCDFSCIAIRKSDHLRASLSQSSSVISPGSVLRIDYNLIFILSDCQNAFVLRDRVVVSFESALFRISDFVLYAASLRDRSYCLEIRYFTSHESITSYSNIRCRQCRSVKYLACAVRFQIHSTLIHCQRSARILNVRKLIGDIFAVFQDNCRLHFVYGSTSIRNRSAYSHFLSESFRQSFNPVNILCQRGAIISLAGTIRCHLDGCSIRSDPQCSFNLGDFVVARLESIILIVFDGVRCTADFCDAASCLDITYFASDKPVARNRYFRSRQSNTVICLAC